MAVALVAEPAEPLRGGLAYRLARVFPPHKLAQGGPKENSLHYAYELHILFLMPIAILRQSPDYLQPTFNPGITTVQLGKGVAGEILGDVAAEQMVPGIGALELATLDEDSLEDGGDLFFLLDDIAQADVVEAGVQIVGVDRAGVAAGLAPQGAALLLEGEEVLEERLLLRILFSGIFANDFVLNLYHGEV